MRATLIALAASCVLAAQTDIVRQFAAQLPNAPDPGAIMMFLAVNEIRAGNQAGALGWLSKAVDLREGFDPSSSPRFAALEKLPAYADLLARVRRDNPPIEQARVAFTASRGVVTEGMAADPESGALFVGSLDRHSIFRIGAGRQWEEFTRPGQDGLEEPLGMAVDPSTRSLWVCSNSSVAHRVLQFDLRSRRLLRKWELPGDPEGHFLNDILVLPGGEAWVTDSSAGVLYRAARDSRALAQIDLGRPFHGANGITAAPGGKRVYVSCSPEGIVIVDREAKSVKPLGRPRGMTLAAIDGLYLRDGVLFGIQNTWVVYRVASWKLNAAGDAIESEEILERASPRMKDPTTGAFLGGTLYFIANSELDHWKDHKLAAPGTLRPTTILAIDVGRSAPAKPSTRAGTGSSL